MGISLSLYKGPSPPLHAAHVCFEQFILCRPLPPVAGSPNLRVLSECPTPGGTSPHPCFVHLFAAIDSLRISSGSALFMKLPLTTCCGYAPRECLSTSPNRPLQYCLPQRGIKVGPSTTRSMSGLILPFTVQFRPMVWLFTLRSACSRR